MNNIKNTSTTLGSQGINLYIQVKLNNERVLYHFLDIFFYITIKLDKVQNTISYFICLLSI